MWRRRRRGKSPRGKEKGRLSLAGYLGGGGGRNGNWASRAQAREALLHPRVIPAREVGCVLNAQISLSGVAQARLPGSHWVVAPKGSCLMWGQMRMEGPGLERFPLSGRLGDGASAWLPGIQQVLLAFQEDGKGVAVLGRV